MQSGTRAASRLFGLVLAACFGLWGAATAGAANVDGAAATPAQSVESDTVTPSQAADEPFEDEIVPPPGQAEDEGDDEGQVEEGCLFMERPLELIV